MKPKYIPKESMSFGGKLGVRNGRLVLLSEDLKKIEYDVTDEILNSRFMRQRVRIEVRSYDKND